MRPATRCKEKRLFLEKIPEYCTLMQQFYTSSPFYKIVACFDRIMACLNKLLRAPPVMPLPCPYLEGCVKTTSLTRRHSDHRKKSPTKTLLEPEPCHWKITGIYLMNIRNLPTPCHTPPSLRDTSPTLGTIPLPPLRGTSSTWCSYLSGTTCHLPYLRGGAGLLRP